MATKRILTGIRPTGPLHLGHYVGALKQWVDLQQEDYECFFLIADVQALTTHIDQPKLMEESVREVVLDWRAVGLDPTRSNVNFVMQSWIPELTELTIYFTLLVKMSVVERNPTVKAERKQLGGNVSAGFMIYPISQAADILFVTPYPPKIGDRLLVPVGEDQVPHLEGTNDIARAFNKRYGEVFLPCKAMVGEVGRLVGTDGKSKMGKSLRNAIYLSDDPKTVEKQVNGMFTDPKRIHTTDLGTVEKNPVFIYHDAFNPNKDEVEDLKSRYREGKVGDVEVKEKLTVVLNHFLDPIRERRKAAESEPLRDYLENGTAKAREHAQVTMEAVREAMHIDYPSLK